MELLKKQIEKYIPYNEQEENDKKIMLEYMNTFDNLLTREKEDLKIKEDENSGVKWIDIKNINKYCTEQWMIDKIYPKLIEKLNIR